LYNVTIHRNIRIKLHKFTDYFIGFEKVESIRMLFGEETKKILDELKVEFYSSRWGYMSVNDEDGHIIISSYYLKHGKESDIYLDIIHELNHIKQYREGKKLFDDRYAYVDRPTEIEAYQITVAEAKRIGMTDEQIIEYLKTEWISDGDLHKLSEILGLVTK